MEPEAHAPAAVGRTCGGMKGKGTWLENRNLAEFGRNCSPGRQNCRQGWPPRWVRAPVTGEIRPGADEDVQAFRRHGHRFQCRYFDRLLGYNPHLRNDGLLADNDMPSGLKLFQVSLSASRRSCFAVLSLVGSEAASRDRFSRRDASSCDSLWGAPKIGRGGVELQVVLTGSRRSVSDWIGV